jgi:hypothetical protein
MDDLDLPPPGVRVNWLYRAGSIAFVLIFVGIITLAFTTRGFWPLAVVFGLICLVGAWLAFSFTHSAACPSCGHLRTVPSGKDNDSVECKDCGVWYHTRDGVSLVTDTDAVEERPRFSAACPTRISWPEGCCVCRGPVTTHEPVELEIEYDPGLAPAALTAAVSLGTFKLVKKGQFRVQVPSCGAHEGPVAELEYRADEAQLYILFRSRAFARAFQEGHGPVFWHDNPEQQLR